MIEQIKGRWIDAQAVAKYLGYSYRQVIERISKLPDFPAPLRAVGAQSYRWYGDDIEAWAMSRKVQPTESIKQGRPRRAA